VLDEREEADRERVPRGLAAGRDQQVEEHQELEIARRRRVPVGARERAVHDGRQHVVARRAALLGDQPRAVLEHRACAACVRASTLAEVAAVVVEGGVGPREEPVAIVLRHAEQARDRLQRQLGGDVEQEVAARRARRAASTIAAVRLAELVSTRASARGDTVAGREPAEALMARVVHHVEEDAGREPVGRGPR
jgi:hypothetical protein